MIWGHDDSIFGKTNGGIALIGVFSMIRYTESSPGSCSLVYSGIIGQINVPCIILVAFIHDRFSTLHVYQGRNLSFFLYLKGPQVATGRYLGMWQGRGQVVV